MKVNTKIPYLSLSDIIPNKSELIKYFSLSVLGYYVSLISIFIIKSHFNVLIVSFLLFILLEFKPRIALYLLFNITLFMGLIGSLFTVPVFLVDKLTVPGAASSATTQLIRFELLPLVFYLHLIFQLITKKKINRSFQKILFYLFTFFIMCLFSFFMNQSHISELVFFIFKYTIVFVIILDVSMMKLKIDDIKFLLRFIIFSITYLQIFLIFIGWVIPSLMGADIYPDFWGGTEGTKSIYFLNIVSVGALLFVTKVLTSSLKEINLSTWLTLSLMIVIIILPYSFLLLVFFFLSVIIISYMINKTALSRVVIASVFIVLLFTTFNLLNKRFSMISMMTNYTIEKLYNLGSIGIKNNPKVNSYNDIAAQYIKDPSSIIYGKGPGLVISGTKLQSNYIGDRSIITGGAETRNFVFYSTFIESGFIAGLMIYLSIFVFFKFFKKVYLIYNDHLAFYAMAIIIYLALVSLVQESFEYPSVALVEGLLIGLIYLNHRRFISEEQRIDK